MHFYQGVSVRLPVGPSIGPFLTCLLKHGFLASFFWGDFGWICLVLLGCFAENYEKYENNMQIGFKAAPEEDALIVPLRFLF